MDQDKVATALASIFKHNFRASLRDHVNPCRIYALPDEGALLNATWPDNTQEPAIPAPYAQEVFSGIEYVVASHLLLHGYLEEANAIVSTARARYDGQRRNPWNEIECGSYYMRSLASYALLLAYTGFFHDAVTRTLRLKPVRKGDFTTFWSGGSGWGIYQHKDNKHILHLIDGVLEIDTLDLPELAIAKQIEVLHEDKTMSTELREGKVIVASTVRMGPGERLYVTVLR